MILYRTSGLLLFLGLMLSQRGWATRPELCPDTRETVGNLRVDYIYFSGTKDCGISVDLEDLPEKWRSHYFGSRGLYSIFNNLGSGADSVDTGARDMWFFPRNGIPSYVVQGNQVVVRYSGLTLTFDALTGLITQSSGGVVVEDPQITRKNKGGIEVQQYSGIYLDCGFKFGSAPYADPRRSSVFYDAFNNTCTVKNSEVFDYDYIKGPNGTEVVDEAYFKFAHNTPDGKDDQGDRELLAFLKKRCPQIQF